MPIRIRNAEVAPHDICEGGCASWMEHWENAARLEAETCSVFGCYEDEDLIGAHIYREFDGEDDSFIIPLCKKHRQMKNVLLEVRKDTKFITDSELYTCPNNLRKKDDDEDDD